ncbi:MAG TPA: DUF2062 domain-containing protein [Terracidiphilus sp.]|nr:DUF2062 domain-containing protein [Terracidiphilus sp.]
MRTWIANRKKQAAEWLQMGMSPRRLALTLALGFVLGCLPVVGVPTALCALAAVALRLNLPAIQAANYAAMPLQLMLMLPLMRLGRWMFASGHEQTLENTLLHGFSLATLRTAGSAAEQALGAWLVLAAPAVLLMTFGLTMVLQRIPAVAEARSR